MASDNHSTRPISVRIGNLQVQGFVNPTTEVANYLGIKYATIPARFRESQPIDPSDLYGVLDATRYGPRCPQPINGPRDTTAHLFQGVRRSSEYPLDEFECLRLNIYTPSTWNHESLPVVVWVHGGGFVFGDGNSEYDGNFLVSHSIKTGKPIIYVAMNYRLGYFGFLASKELKTEAMKNGEAGFSNLGMFDQRVALLWVRCPPLPLKYTCWLMCVLSRFRNTFTILAATPQK